MSATNTSSLFAPIALAPRDPILGITEAFNADPNPARINLGVGVYVGDDGRVPLLECVQRAETLLLEGKQPLSYLPIDGLQSYDKAASGLVFGADSPAVTEGRVVAVQALGGTGGISGGFDSAVSSWLMLKRGISLDYLFCNLGGDAYERAVVQVTKALADDWSYGSQPKLYVVDFDEPLRELRAKTRENYWQLVLKRLMYRAASQIGQAIGAEAIITGEAVGQVSSQTLTNLRAIDSAASLPVFRPLLGFDKEEIIERARHIGTAALSEQVKEYCAIAPGHPVTAAREHRVIAEENKMDLSVIDRAVEAAKRLNVRQLSPTDLVAPYIFADDVMPGAVLIDCRTEQQFNAWHAPGALHREEWELARDYKRLDRDRKYLLYCAHGIQSAHLAEKMQRAGYEAYSFKGGVAALRKLVGP
jgi:thiamine biosynthesis protein ThiI